MDSDITWKILDKYFSDNPTAFVNHHLESFNNFYGKDINQIFKEKNPIKIMKAQDSETKNFKYRANLYLGGKNGDKLYFGKPIIFDEDREHYMYPNEARLRNMTYGMTIHYDVEVEFFIENDDGGKDVFLHVSALEAAGIDTLEEGMPVEFEIGENRGKENAINIKKK